MALGYRCRGCGTTKPEKWKGPCPNCAGLWSIRSVTVAEADVPGAQRAFSVDGELISLADVALDVEEDEKRIAVGGGLACVDVVLGGGVVPGSLILLTGPPGIGKSTLLLQWLNALAARRHDVVYVAGEESTRQVARRAKRLNTLNPRLQVVRLTDIDDILDAVQSARPKLVVVDSIQTVQVTDEFAVGSPSSIATATRAFAEFSQAEEIAFVIVGHVTKDGDLAGPKALEHFVDVSIVFEGSPDSTERKLSCPSKNRHGAAGPQATAKFEMTDRGLVPVADDGKRAA